MGGRCSLEYGGILTSPPDAQDPSLGSRSGLWPYHPERAGSQMISEAKQGWVWLVLGWEDPKSQLTEVNLQGLENEFPKRMLESVV